MPGNPLVYATRQYEFPAYGSSASAMPPGVAVKSVKLPTSLTTPDNIEQVAAAGPTDLVLGTVSLGSAPISSAAAGRVVGANALRMPCKLSATTAAGVKIAVKTTDGRFAAAAAGDTPFAITLEAGATDEAVWAQVL